MGKSQEQEQEQSTAEEEKAPAKESGKVYTTSAKLKNAGYALPVEVDFVFPGTVEALIENWGEKVIYSNACANMTVQLQHKVRAKSEEMCKFDKDGKPIGLIFEESSEIKIKTETSAIDLKVEKGDDNSEKE